MLRLPATRHLPWATPTTNAGASGSAPKNAAVMHSGWTAVVSAADLIESIRAQVIDDPAWLLCDRPSCRGCGLAREYLAGEIDQIISGDLSA